MWSSYEELEALIGTPDGFENPGYTFAGWDKGEKTYIVKWIDGTYRFYGDTELVAKWDLDVPKYTMDVIAVGDDDSRADIGSFEIEDLTRVQSHEIPDYSGYTFDVAEINLWIISDDLVSIIFNPTGGTAVTDGATVNIILKYERTSIPVEKHTLVVFGENGTVTGSGVYESGEVVNVTAIADSGYNFDNWEFLV